MKRKYGILALCCVFMLISVSCGMQGTKGVQSAITGLGDVKMLKIISNMGNVRSGCGSDTPVLQASPKDTKLDVIGQIENWYAVKLANSKIGFVHQSEGTPVVSGKPPAGTGAQASAAPGGKIPDNVNSNQTGLTANEQQMLKLVNQARAQNNAPALKVDNALTNMARVKAQDMIDNNYFSHNSPTYGSPFDMMKSFGIQFVKAGENIAGNQTVQNAFDAFMNSPGHRANILEPAYTHIGLGIRKGSQYGNIFTQEFISKPQ